MSIDISGSVSLASCTALVRSRARRLRVSVRAGATMAAAISTVGVAQAQTYTLSTLASFNGANGANSDAGLTFDANGNLYGTTALGGAGNLGTVFEIAAGTNTITSLASFNGTNGRAPEAGLIVDSSGNLYGTALGGGASGDGTVFKVAAATNTITTLASFNGTNGRGPYDSLTADANGNLYGTTYEGGSSNDGTVFKIAAGTNTLSTAASFNSTNGMYPEGGLTIDASGNLYGTTSIGGADNDGTVFKIAAGTNTIASLATFNNTNGAGPYAGLTIDGNGNLYGTTSGGGANGDGTVFEIAAGTNTLTTLASFNGTNGANSDASLTLDASGNLYGTTSIGGADNDGNVFEIAAGTNAITTLATFNGTNGLYPEAGLTFGPNGNLYGTTAEGGAHGDGTVFELTSAGGSAAAPEPSSFLLLLVVPGALGLVSANQRTRLRR